MRLSSHYWRMIVTLSVAIVDLYSRKVLSWRVSNTMTPDFCVEALQEALERHGKLAIFNTDPGSQFTSNDWIDTLTDAQVHISMDGKGRWIDNSFYRTAVAQREVREPLSACVPGRSGTEKGIAGIL